MCTAGDKRWKLLNSAVGVKQRRDDGAPKTWRDDIHMPWDSCTGSKGGKRSGPGSLGTKKGVCLSQGLRSAGPSVQPRPQRKTPTVAVTPKKRRKNDHSHGKKKPKLPLRQRRARTLCSSHSTQEVTASTKAPVHEAKATAAAAAAVEGASAKAASARRCKAALPR